MCCLGREPENPLPLGSVQAETFTLPCPEPTRANLTCNCPWASCHPGSGSPQGRGSGWGGAGVCVFQRFRCLGRGGSRGPAVPWGGGRWGGEVWAEPPVGVECCRQGAGLLTEGKQGTETCVIRTPRDRADSLRSRTPPVLRPWPHLCTPLLYICWQWGEGGRRAGELQGAASPLWAGSPLLWVTGRSLSPRSQQRANKARKPTPLAPHPQGPLAPTQQPGHPGPRRADGGAFTRSQR